MRSSPCATSSKAANTPRWRSRCVPTKGSRCVDRTAVRGKGVCFAVDALFRWRGRAAGAWDSRGRMRFGAGRRSLFRCAGYAPVGARDVAVPAGAVCRSGERRIFDSEGRINARKGAPISAPNARRQDFPVFLCGKFCGMIFSLYICNPETRVSASSAKLRPGAGTSG